MAGKGLGDPSEQLMAMVGAYNILNIALEERQCLGPSWFLSRKDIEEHSPSRKDGINLKKETQLRVLYCSFLQDLGKKLKVPQMTIATAIMLCHRFYLRQSHAKNEWQTIATACMFLAGKVEETPRLLTDVVVVAYETMYRRDPAAVQRIRQKEFYEKQKELIVTGERLLLATIGFDLNIHHPYKPLVAALKKLKISQDDVAQVAWNFVNDWFRTTLCLQYKPHYIAAGSLFLAAKFHKVKLPSEKGMVWWHEFDITPRQLEEVIQQMLEYVEMRKKTVVPATSVKASTPVVAEKTPSSSPDSCVLSGSATVDSMHVKEVGGGKSAVLTSRSSVNQNPVDAGSLVERESQCQTSDCGSAHSVVEDEERFEEGENQVRAVSVQFSTSKIISLHKGLDAIEDGERLGEGENQVQAESVPLSESKIISLHKGLNAIDKDRIKARLARRKRERELTKVAVVDDSNGEDWIERELENGIQSRVELLQKKQRLV